MYLYHFNSYIGTDRVSFTQQDLGNPGDVFFYKTEYILMLGEDVAWKEQIKKEWTCDLDAIHERYTNVVAKDALQLIHWFVNERYTTYKNTVPLWFHDVEDIIKRSDRSNRSERSDRSDKSDKSHRSIKNNKKWVFENGILIQCNEEIVGQQLIVFPDVWTMNNSIQHSVFGTQKNIAMLHGKSTKKQKSEVFWNIRNGKISTLLCTYSQVFQPWNDLQSIVLVDQHKWYYKNQQDPRYFVPTVIEKMSEIYEAKIHKTGEGL